MLSYRLCHQHGNTHACCEWLTPTSHLCMQLQAMRSRAAWITSPGWRGAHCASPPSPTPPSSPLSRLVSGDATPLSPPSCRETPTEETVIRINLNSSFHSSCPSSCFHPDNKESEHSEPSLEVLEFHPGDELSFTYLSRRIAAVFGNVHWHACLTTRGRI